MGRPSGWITKHTGRPPMPSPGRPGVNQREAKQAFWKGIAEGRQSEAAALACGISQPVGTRWFREAGGIPPISLVPASGRYLSFAEREELALLRTQQYGVREIARRMARSPATISRELRRNAATRGGVLHYRGTVAQWKAEQAAKRPKVGQTITVKGVVIAFKPNPPNANEPFLITMNEGSVEGYLPAAPKAQ